MDGASPTEQVSKYSIPYFLAVAIASTLVTPAVAEAPLFLPVWRSSLLPTRIRMGASQPLSGPHSEIHYSTCSKVPLLVTSNRNITAVDPFTYLWTYLWCRSFPGMSK